MLIIVCSKFWNERQNTYELLADYAVDIESLCMYPVQNIKPELLGAVFNPDINEWVLVDK